MSVCACVYWPFMCDRARWSDRALLAVVFHSSSSMALCFLLCVFVIFVDVVGCGHAQAPTLLDSGTYYISVSMATVWGEMSGLAT